MIRPTSWRWTPSGLMRTRVRSVPEHVYLGTVRLDGRGIVSDGRRARSVGRVAASVPCRCRSTTAASPAADRRLGGVRGVALRPASLGRRHPAASVEPSAASSSVAGAAVACCRGRRVSSSSSASRRRPPGGRGPVDLRSAGVSDRPAPRSRRPAVADVPRGPAEAVGVTAHHRQRPAPRALGLLSTAGARAGCDAQGQRRSARAA